MTRAGDADGNGGAWRCLLCPRRCLWTAREPLGRCRVRGLSGGSPSLPGWGRCVGISADPIEKKPLYHFHPGTMVLSTGPAGCNLSCSFCQNWEISQQESPTRLVAPADLASAAVSGGSSGLAFTYTEPVVWLEYIVETAPIVRRAGGFIVMVSNGYVEPGPLDELLEVTDAWNVDLKGWRDSFYRGLCGGSREPVLRSIERIAGSGRHLEVTFLLIPGENDDPADWPEMASWLSDHAGRATPLHISRYFPRYRMDRPPTPPDTIRRAVEAFSKRLDFVYPGNLGGECDTLCPECGTVLIERSGYSVRIAAMSSGRCMKCGRDVGIVT
ncbi:MAG: AmmeMemoRadiSam system radical SAM enzyme [Candidatus Fermentibacter sp.]|nr:AmmeMemoRadiSam system radical SAM enzyme [Candidatus Fermentibacter sp.]